jgi:hypothetical protein
MSCQLLRIVVSPTQVDSTQVQDKEKDDEE